MLQCCAIWVGDLPNIGLYLCFKLIMWLILDEVLMIQAGRLLVFSSDTWTLLLWVLLRNKVSLCFWAWCPNLQKPIIQILFVSLIQVLSHCWLAINHLIIIDNIFIVPSSLIFFDNSCLVFFNPSFYDFLNLVSIGFKLFHQLLNLSSVVILICQSLKNILALLLPSFLFIDCFV